MTEKNDKGWVDNVRVLDGGDVPPREERGALARVPAAALSVDAARVASETQAMVMLARQAPRDILHVKRTIKETCGRLRFAEKASFRFSRGGTHVTGPSIRLMEALVGAMGNIDTGWRVMESEPDRVRVEAYAWDMETNTRKRLDFWVSHIRDTKEGPVPLTSERDRYENVASLAQRRVRACIQNIIPFDLVDEAQEICAETIKRGDGTKPLRDRIAAMVLAFEDLGVNQAMIAANLGHAVDAIIVDELPRLREIYNALAEGHGRREDYFDLSLAGQAPAAAPKGEQPPAAAQKPADPPAAAPARAADPPAPLELDAAGTAAQAALVLKRLRAYKLTDAEIANRLGGPIAGAPLDELERVYREEEGRRLAKRRGKAAPDPETGEIPAFALESPPSDAAGPQGGRDDGEF